MDTGHHHNVNHLLRTVFAVITTQKLELYKGQVADGGLMMAAFTRCDGQFSTAWKNY